MRRLVPHLRREARLTGLALWRGLIGTYSGDDLTFAASIAYYALLSLFPFFLLLMAVIGGATTSEADRQAVLTFVLSYFPRQFDFVATQLDAMQESRVQLGVAGSLVMVWAAMGVFGAITSAVNHAWGVEKQPTFFKHKMVSFVMLVAASLLLLAAILFMSVINIVQAHWFIDLSIGAPVFEAVQGFVARWASTVAFVIVVGLVFYFVPNARVRFRDVWVGAIITGLLWSVAFTGFSWYLRDISRFDRIHGSIATVIVFLFWIYTSAVILLYGVQVTAANARLRRHRPDEIPAAPTPRM
jgi:membrane protein